MNGIDYITDVMKKIFSFKAKLEGLGSTMISETTEMAYQNSRLMTQKLTDLIFTQQNTMKMDQKKVENALNILEKKEGDNQLATVREEKFQQTVRAGKKS